MEDSAKEVQGSAREVQDSAKEVQDSAKLVEDSAKWVEDMAFREVVDTTSLVVEVQAARVKEDMDSQVEAVDSVWQVEFKDMITGRAAMWVPSGGAMVGSYHWEDRDTCPTDSMDIMIQSKVLVERINNFIVLNTNLHRSSAECWLPC